MAWYYGTYSCGHDGRINVVGKVRERQGKADWTFGGVCPECYKKQREKEREKKYKNAVLKTAEMELPELEGTEKQIKWATTLRIDFIDNLYSKLNMVKDLDKTLTIRDKDKIVITTSKKELLEAIEFGLKEFTDVKLWIDLRRFEMKQLLIFVNKYREINSNQRK